MITSRNVRNLELGILKVTLTMIMEGHGSENSFPSSVSLTFIERVSVSILHRQNQKLFPVNTPVYLRGFSCPWLSIPSRRTDHFLLPPCNIVCRPSKGTTLLTPGLSQSSVSVNHPDRRDLGTRGLRYEKTGRTGVRRGVSSSSDPRPCRSLRRIVTGIRKSRRKFGTPGFVTGYYHELSSENCPLTNSVTRFTHLYVL